MIRIINHHNHFTITPLFYSIAITRGQGPLQIRGDGWLPRGPLRAAVFPESVQDCTDIRKDVAFASNPVFHVATQGETR